MAAIVLVNFKNSTKLQNFVADADSILRNRGFVVLAPNPRIYFNAGVVSQPTLTAAVNMLKKSEYYNAVVKEIMYSNQFRK